MSWIDTLDRLIADSWMASRDESAVMLDSLLALSLAERWDLFVTRDTRLSFLSDEDYVVLFQSLNTHAMMAHVGDGAVARAVQPPTEEATAVLPEEAELESDGAEESYGEDHHHAEPFQEAEPPTGLRGWLRSRRGIRWLTGSAVIATGLMLVGALLTVTVLYLLPSGHKGSGTDPGSLTVRLNDIERDQVQLAKQLILVDNRVGDLSRSVDVRIGATLRAVRLTSAFDQLQAALERGGPFNAELGRIAPAISIEPALAGLLRNLDGYGAGVPAIPALRDRFDEMAPRLGGLVPPTEQNAAGRVGDSSQEGGLLSGVLTWIGLVESADAKRFRAALGSIHAALGLGNLASAVRQVEALNAYPAEPVQRWLAAARVRLDAEAALIALRQGALAIATASEK